MPRARPVASLTLPGHVALERRQHHRRDDRRHSRVTGLCHLEHDRKLHGRCAKPRHGTVSLGDGSAFHTLNVAGNFSGADGTIIFNTVLAGDNAATDKRSSAVTPAALPMCASTTSAVPVLQTDKGIELIQVGGTSNGQFNLSGRAVAVVQYFLHKGTGADGNWYLRSQLPTVPDPCEANPGLPQCPPVDVDPVDPVDPWIRSIRNRCCARTRRLPGQPAGRADDVPPGLPTATPARTPAAPGPAWMARVTASMPSAASSTSVATARH